jgi:nitrilase
LLIGSAGLIIARGKYDLDVVGHSARPDLLKLTIDTSPQSAVSFAGEQALTGENDGDRCGC